MSRRKKIFIWLAVAKLLVTLIFLSIFVFFADRTNFYLSRIGSGFPSITTTQHFSGTYLQLHPSGMFNIEIIYQNETLFAAIGTWNRSGGGIYFHYLDVTIQNHTNQFHLGQTRRYNTSNRQVDFRDHENREFFFRR